MTPDWAVVRTGLLAWALARSGLTTRGGARWADEPLRPTHGATIELSVVAVRGRGSDETVFEDAGGGDLDAATGGHRELVLQIAVDAPSQELDSSAPVIAERIRSKATSPASLEQLEGLGLGLLSTGEVISYATRDAGGRAHSRAVLEVRVSFVSAELDEPVGVIESASMVGAVTRPDTTQITVPVTAST